MADYNTWEEIDFWNEAVEFADAVSSNPTQPSFCHPPTTTTISYAPPPSTVSYAPPPSTISYAPPPSTISYSPPRQLLSPKEDNHHHHSSNDHEISRLKDELGRVSKLLANLEQECFELRKDREKNEKHLRLLLPVNGSEDAETFCTNKSNLKNKDLIEDPSLGTKGVISCKAVGVQTDEHSISTDLTIKKNSPASRKLVGIWELQNDQIPRTNLVSKLFVACEAELQVLFGFLGLNIPSKKTTTKVVPNHCIQSAEAAKVSHLYLTLTKISYDTGKFDDLLEALVDLCGLQNVMIVYRSLCVLHVVLKHILNMGNKLCHRDTVIINDPSTSEMGEFTNETSNPRLLMSAKNKGKSRNESRPLISSSKWFSLFQTMHQVVTRQCEENIKVEAVSIMNILLLRTDAYTEREMYGEVSIFQSISHLLKKEAPVSVKKQVVHLLYLLLNCPKLLVMFCSSSLEEETSGEVSRTNAENGHTFEGLGSVLDGLADCLACHGNGAPTNLVLKLQRNTIVLLAFLASSGTSGFEILLGRNLSRTNFLYLILQVMTSEIDVETPECIQPPEDFRERTLLIREALILLNRLVSNSQYSTPVLRVLTNRRDMAILTIDIATRLSRKPKLFWQSDTMRELEIVDLARIFKKRVFTFLGDAT